jgi:hypothetical protein
MTGHDPRVAFGGDAGLRAADGCDIAAERGQAAVEAVAIRRSMPPKM